MAHLLDTSALLKLVVAEDETAALRAWLAAEERHPTASDLARTELVRAVRRRAPERLVMARLVLDGVTLVQVASDTFVRAGWLDPDGLRSLDAVHLATALELGDDLEAVVTYDARQAAAAEANGFVVVAPA